MKMLQFREGSLGRMFGTPDTISLAILYPFCQTLLIPIIPNAGLRFGVGNVVGEPSGGALGPKRPPITMNVTYAQSRRLCKLDWQSVNYHQGPSLLVSRKPDLGARTNIFSVRPKDLPALILRQTRNRSISDF